MTKPNSLSMLIKQIFQIVTITVVLFLVLDFGLGFMMNDSVAYMCRDEVVHHRYCPRATRTYRMHSADGGQVIESHWNLDGVRVEEGQKDTNTDFTQFDHILIGDSFIAQRQVEYSERISAILNSNGTSSVQLGTGSWNLVNYRNFIRNTQFSDRATIHIFLMANDFYSKYAMSTAKYYESTNQGSNWPGNKETLLTKAKRFIANKSFTYQTLAFKWNKNSDAGKRRHNSELPKLELRQVMKDCEKLNKWNSVLSDLAYSLVEQAFDPSCLSEEAQRNIVIANRIFQEIATYAEVNGLNIKYYLVPNGTIFRDEVKEFKKIYGIHPDSVVTSNGLYEALKEFLGRQLVSIEMYARQHKGDRDLYYSYDGHWNAVGSELIAQLVLERASSKGK